MRAIEAAMVIALTRGIDWHQDNTTTSRDGTVYLFGNRIAYKHDGELVIDWTTFDRWPTATTKSRLRALGLDYKAPRVRSLYEP